MKNKRNKENKDDESDDESKDPIDKKRLSIINEIFKNFIYLFNKKNYDDIPNSFKEDKNGCIERTKKVFTELEYEEIIYILYAFNFVADKSVKNIINFLDTINTILSHCKFYDKNRKIKFNNCHFDNYLLNRYNCTYIFTNYFLDRGCRELKINNLLYFNYIPIICKYEEHKPLEKNKVDQNEIEECPYAHNKVEQFCHPFVYKKFKCFDNQCKNKNCHFYHENEEGEPIDFETEVDFDSNEIIYLQKVLSNLGLNKEDKINAEKKEKDTGGIPSEFHPRTYKRNKCPLGKLCKLDEKLCLNYHGIADKRRNPDKHKFTLCPNFYDNNIRKKDGKCKDGDDCEFSHNYYEYFYHPDKFRTKKCPKEKKDKYCKRRLVCPYFHKTDSDCGEGENKMVLDEKLITNYYNSLIIGYENSIDDENEKLNEIEKKYVCYLCRERHTNALNSKEFLIDKKENKIVCLDCANDNNIQYNKVEW